MGTNIWNKYWKTRGNAGTRVPLLGAAFGLAWLAWLGLASWVMEEVGTIPIKIQQVAFPGVWSSITRIWSQGCDDRPWLDNIVSYRHIGLIAWLESWPIRWGDGVPSRLSSFLLCTSPASFLRRQARIFPFLRRWLVGTLLCFSCCFGLFCLVLLCFVLPCFFFVLLCFAVFCSALFSFFRFCFIVFDFPN